MLYKHMNNDIDNDSVTRNGRIYHYDPDSDIYYAYQEETIADKWVWIVVIAVLALGCLSVEYGDAIQLWLKSA